MNHEIVIEWEDLQKCAYEEFYRTKPGFSVGDWCVYQEDQIHLRAIVEGRLQSFLLSRSISVTDTNVTCLVVTPPWANRVYRLLWLPLKLDIRRTIACTTVWTSTYSDDNLLQRYEQGNYIKLCAKTLPVWIAFIRWPRSTQVSHAAFHNSYIIMQYFVLRNA